MKKLVLPLALATASQLDGRNQNKSQKAPYLREPICWSSEGFYTITNKFEKMDQILFLPGK